MGNDIWTKKYETKIIGRMQENAALIRDFIFNFKNKKKKGLLVYGPTGCGKTSSVHAIAREAGLELIELNASDLRDADSINSVAGNASKQMSLFSKGKVILIDDLDGMSGNHDRGGIGAIESIIETTCFPVILTINDPFEKKHSQIKKKCLLAEFSGLSSIETQTILKSICEFEHIEFDESALKSLALRSGGDVRAAINDLQILSQHSKKLEKADVDNLSERNREESITEALTKIFRSSEMKLAIAAFDNVNEEPDKCLQWIDENLPSEYKDLDDLNNAYEHISKSDVFSGRIRRSQYWRLLVYIYALISAGVALSKKTKSREPIKYMQPTRHLKAYIAKNRNQKGKAIVEKIAERTGSSIRCAYSSYLPYIKIISRRNIALSEMIASDLDLDSEETDWLRSC